MVESVKVSPQLRSWLWFAALYLGGVGTLAAVAYGLRVLLKLIIAVR